MIGKGCVVNFARIVFMVAGVAVAGRGVAMENPSAGLLDRGRTTWPPRGKPFKFPLNRDTLVSAVGREKYANNGRSFKLKTKGPQEFSLFDADLSNLRGRVVTGALLHFRCLSPRAPQRRLAVSTVAAQWVEGSGDRYKPQEGSSCFAQAEYRKRNWAYPGSSLLDVVLGRGQTLWAFAEASPPQKGGWQAVAVHPAVIGARVAELSYGFLLSDEVGSEWSQRGGKFTFTYFPNRFIASREGKERPWLEVWVDGTDDQPPRALRALTVQTGGLPAGQALVKWKTPRDNGPAGTLGFLVAYACKAGKGEVPRYLVPMAGKPGAEVRMLLRDLPFQPGETVELSVAAVDGAGNMGQVLKQKIRVSDKRALSLPATTVKAFAPGGSLPVVGGLRVAVIDLLDKVDPVSGSMIPAHPAAYLAANHLFSAARKLVRLHAGRNETVAFQLNLAGCAQGVKVSCGFAGAPGLRPRLFRFAYVKTGKGMLPDPLLPLTGTVSIPVTAPNPVPGQKNLSLVCEIYVPRDLAAGNKRGELVIEAGGQRLALGVELTVWDFTLPNKLSFIPEMNAYGTVNPYKGYAYYRLAHEHRVCINRLPYHWNGRSVSFRPSWNGNDFDWGQWDSKVGPLLDGSAFKGLPREGEPVDVMYLPFNEAWPVDISRHFRPSYWIEDALGVSYRRELSRAFAAFARHCNAKGYHDTIFEFYLNNKIYYRRKSPKVTSPWIFDEPVSAQDFWALRWYGILWHQAVDPVRGKAMMWYRCDISRTSLTRDLLWGVMDIECVGGSNTQKMRMKHDEQFLGEPNYFTEYGSANPVEASNIQPAAWCLSAWSKGAIGVLPWQTVGGKNCWRKGEKTCLFYPRRGGPVASVRLKAFTVGQQLAEYLTLLQSLSRQPRFAVAAGLRKLLDLSGHIKKTSESDAGTARFRLTPEKIWELRMRLGEYISRKAPPYKRALVQRREMRFAPKRLGYCPVAPPLKSSAPVCDKF